MQTGLVRSRLHALAAAAIIASAALFTPAQAAEIAVKHAQGETTLPDRPVKVVTFDYATLETLDAIGVEVAGVPGSNTPGSLAKYADAKYAKVGTIFEPDYEAVNAAEPDLIIVAGRSANKYPQLAKIAPTIDLSVDPMNFVASARTNAETLGRIFGKEAEVAKVLSDMDAAISAVKAGAPSLGKGLILMTNGGKVIAFGPGSRFGWLHDDLGIAPVTQEIKTKGTHGQAVSFEFIQQQNPDVILVLDRDRAISRPEGGNASKTLDNELVATTSAAKKEQIAYLDPVRLYIVGGSPVSITAIANQINTLIKEKKS
ncbi:iron ABC transporter substrate-binding protein [Agaricicola taiwanensis]|uniref:Iron ABC transporter substrate-binding protein n=1 Tax=Agaricicola taiwanensis TaxID=591372 RepID=A0A8J2YKL0_9RHOB|nr:siderophore ABC transporter substrate-binding protein [Agaricicola taiwanensis]GGE48697.1 iron ABC transporter substrate-binding protein [Agaricicola taiwanensis]